MHLFGRLSLSHTHSLSLSASLDKKIFPKTRCFSVVECGIGSLPLLEKSSPAKKRPHTSANFDSRPPAGLPGLRDTTVVVLPYRVSCFVGSDRGRSKSRNKKRFNSKGGAGGGGARRAEKNATELPPSRYRPSLKTSQRSEGSCIPGTNYKQSFVIFLRFLVCLVFFLYTSRASSLGDGTW